NAGNAHREMKHLDKAIAAYTEAIRLNPSFAQAYTDRGVIYYRLDRYDEAIADYEKSLDLRPQHAPTYFNRAGAYRQKGDTVQAIADYSKALELDPALVQAKTKLQELGVVVP